MLQPSREDKNRREGERPNPFHPQALKAYEDFFCLSGELHSYLLIFFNIISIRLLFSWQWNLASPTGILLLNIASFSLHFHLFSLFVFLLVRELIPHPSSSSGFICKPFNEGFPSKNCQTIDLEVIALNSPSPIFPEFSFNWLVELFNKYHLPCHFF